MVRSCKVLGLLAVAGSLSLPAAAQFAKPEDAIKYRKSVMFAQQIHLGRIFAMANGRIPFDAKVVADDAAVLDVIDKLPFSAFVEGTNKGETNAKPNVWTERAKFDAAAKRMQDEVGKLVAAAKTGSQETVRGAVGGVAGACKACHDDFRAL